MGREMAHCLHDPSSDDHEIFVESACDHQGRDTRTKSSCLERRVKNLKGKHRSSDGTLLLLGETGHGQHFQTLTAKKRFENPTPPLVKFKVGNT